MQPEPHIELAPLSERLAIWTIAAIGPWICIAWTARVLGWL
jgi:hypothetical protein